MRDFIQIKDAAGVTRFSVNVGAIMMIDHEQCRIMLFGGQEVRMSSEQFQRFLPEWEEFRR